MTNGDKIRSLSDEKLAELLEPGCPENKECMYTEMPTYETCVSCWLQHLQGEAES